MMPTHGDGPFRSFLVGSATVRVLHRAKCAVWTGTHPEDEAAGRRLAVRKILCAVDLERESTRLAESACEKPAKLQQAAGADFEVSMEGGRISAVVRNPAIRFAADLIVIGRGHTHSVLSRLRSNAYAIIRDAPCPVISL
jgi:nucleotide-binding universal stress UspA family protein